MKRGDSNQYEIIFNDDDESLHQEGVNKSLSVLFNLRTALSHLGYMAERLFSDENDQMKEHRFSDMSSVLEPGGGISRIERELYFLIARFLSAGPCQGAAELLPMRIDWEGKEHFRSYESLVSLYRHIRSDHLLKICHRIGPLLEKEVPPSVTGVASLLGAGRQSMLRTIEDVKHIRWKPEVHVATRHGRPLAPPPNLAHPPNIIHILNARSLIGQQRDDHACCTRIYSHMTRLSRSLGHLSAVYCLCFDRTGEYFITGADDHLIKIWSALSGRLLGTLRGHSAEITDMAVNYENTLLASGSCDKFVRVWCLRSLAPVAVLHGHSGMVTSLQFCPYQRGNTRFLASTGGDGGVCFWKWQVDSNKFDNKPVKFVEKSRAGAQMLCSSFSPGGIFLTTGNSDQVVRVYSLAGPQIEKICELEAHMDRIDSISYSNRTSRFVTGSKDGFARIWRFDRQEWINTVLNTSKRLDSKPGEIELINEKLRVTMVCWNADDMRVITAVSDCSLKVWDSYTGELLKILQCHQDEVFVLEHHPIDSRIILSAGHDGNILIWDIEKGVVVKKYFNNIQGQGHGAVFDCKWAPDGLSFASTDSHGFIMYFGYGSNEIYQRLPEDMFFHTDYRPLIRDANNFILDEQTQQPPHLMPPPFLVDIDGNPHPPRYQRLVPGRENCQDTQLIPQLGVLPNGDREVLDDILEAVEQASAEAEPAPAPAPPADHEQEDGDRIIDVMIERLLQEQNERMGEPRQESVDHGSGGEGLHSPRRDGPLSPAIRGLRRSGEEQGVRQASGNVPVSRRATARDLANWSRRVVIRELDYAKRRCISKKHHQMADYELKRYLLERKRKPLPQSDDSSDSSSYMKTRHRKQTHHGHGTHAGLNEETTVNRLATRALYDTEEEAEDSAEVTAEELEDLGVVLPNAEESDHMWKSSSDSESSDYSDWTADAGLNLEPPKRKSGRQVKRRHLSSSDDDTDDDDDDEDDDHDSRDEEYSCDSGPSTSRRTTQPKKQTANKKKPLKQTKRERKQQKKKQKLLNAQDGITELPDAFKIPEWLTESVPRKSPYFPQMGDEVIYFRQGHELYLKAVKMRNAYDVDITRNQPWHKIPGLKEMELVKVVGLKYEVKPPRLVCLKLALIDPETHKQTGGKFSVKYHDMADVIDFIILKQNHDIAINRNWKVGDRFRSLIDDAWWMGVIESKTAFEESHPDSMFQCFTVHWDNGEVEKMSPWDLEPISEDRLPKIKGGSVPVTERELAALTYKPKSSDWPSAGLDIECDRISQDLDKVMELSIAEHFLAPVDLNAFPIYGMIIAYPIDLSLIKSRLEKRFYRRVNSIQFDVRHIESNAVAFNEPKSRIVKLAKQVTELCLRVISDTDCFDPMPIYNDIIKDADFAITPIDGNHLSHNGHVEDVSAPGPSRSSTTRSSSLLPRTQKLEVNLSPTAWKAQCRQLLDIMFDCEDSKPFRHPVDPVQYSEYYQIIDHPMDLGTIKEQIDCDVYETPVEFCKDVRLVFNNSRMYNTNKRSRIYTMTLRLSAMFEEQIRDIISGWKQVSKGRRMSKRHTKSRKDLHSIASPGVSAFSESPHSSFLCLPSTSNYSKVSSSGSTLGSGYSKGKAIARRPDVSSKVSRRIIDDSEEEEDELDATKNDESDNEDDSDSDYKAKKPKSSTRPKASPGDKKLVNGTGKRYSTRVATGSIQRKNYNRVLSDHSNQENDSPEESGDERTLHKKSSKAVINHPQILPKNSSRRRTRIASDSDDNVKPKTKHRKIQSGSSEDEEEDPPPKRVSRTRSSQKVLRSSKYNHVDEEDDNDAEDEEVEEKSEESEEESGPDGSDETAHSNTSADEEEEEEDAEEESGVTTRATRSSLRRTSTKSIHSSQEKASSSHKDVVPVSRNTSRKRYRTRNRGQRTVVYREDSEDNEAASEEEVTSVSSRGRIRRITPRARALFS
ncbi:hypothetical protein LSH36_253g03021 [Paralvinella palmiformis]|uniref:Bromo domain-containing protein n=1 Tax=Paralvinella palmiformis TaxID=53620 RepID=A0AAD9JKK9_9ANNE|nr:hypothetical protein LSH36_253g03021 [Paralvinella palmiformis]